MEDHQGTHKGTRHLFQPRTCFISHPEARRAEGSLERPSGEKRGPQDDRAYETASGTFRFCRRGFTLVEILLVVIIIGALSAMLIPRLAGRSDQARTAAAKADVTVNIPTALKLYELDNGFFPSSEQGLEALLKKSSTDPVPENWNGPYLEHTPIDPWGRPYQYEAPGTHRPHDYDLSSLGKNAKAEAKDDDIVNW